MHFDTNQENVNLHATCRKPHKWPDERKQIKRLITLSFEKNIAYFQIISSFLSAERECVCIITRLRWLTKTLSRKWWKKLWLVDLNSVLTSGNRKHESSWMFVTMQDVKWKWKAFWRKKKYIYIYRRPLCLIEISKTKSWLKYDVSCRQRLHPKAEKCCKAGRHQGTSESKISFTSCLMRYPYLIDFWRQHRCILRCLWYPTILCVPFLDGWAKK